MDIQLIDKATRLAVNAHKDQVRKDDDSPYVVHPIMVSLILSQYNFKSEVVAAGLAHDVLEDTSVGEDELELLLGSEVLRIVKGVSEKKDLAWEDRKKLYRETIENSDESIKAVSIADKIHNMESLLSSYRREGDALWEKFSRGRDIKMKFEYDMLASFKRSWKHPLIERYEKLLDEAKMLCK